MCGLHSLGSAASSSNLWPRTNQRGFIAARLLERLDSCNTLLRLKSATCTGFRQALGLPEVLTLTAQLLSTSRLGDFRSLQQGRYLVIKCEVL